jgi:hypothetical protein
MAPFFKSINNSQKLFVMIFILDIWSTELSGAMSKKMVSSPYWENTEFNAKSDAFVSKKNGFEESACIRIGADVNAFLSTSKVFSIFSFYTNLSFSMKRVNGAPILE